MSHSGFFNERTITMGVMDDSAGRESSDHKSDSYQKHWHLGSDNAVRVLH